MLSNSAMGSRLRLIGEKDARAGKSIEAFYDIPKIRHTEGMRAAYEIGYRAAKNEMRGGRLQGEQLALPIKETVITPRERELEIALRDLLTAFDSLMPGLAHIAVQDYEIVNRAPIQARKVLGAL